MGPCPFLLLLLPLLVAVFTPLAVAAPGDVDTSFNLSYVRGPFPVYSTAVQANGKIVIGGKFTTVDEMARNTLGRLNVDGTEDLGFNSELGNRFIVVVSTAVQADGKIVVGGTVRLDANGTLDTSFSPTLDGTVSGMAVQPDGKIVIGGDFTTVNGRARNRIARLEADGTLDIGFDPNANNRIFSLALQTDGKIVIGGDFTVVSGRARNRIARLNSDGTLDFSFDLTANNSVLTTIVQADSKIIIGGAFTTLGGVTRNRIARLNADGTLDVGFNPDAGGGVFPLIYSTALQADGRIVVVGGFTEIGGTSRAGVARLNADGTLDPDINPVVKNSDVISFVYGVALQADGKIVLGGDFSSLGRGIARLANDAATQSLTVSGTNRLEWLRGGASPEAQDVAFELSSDTGATWSSIGAGRRISGGWELTGLNLPINSLVRARARVVSGSFNASAGLIEAVVALPANDAPTVANPIADFAVSEDAADTVIELRTVFEDRESADADLVYSIRANSNPTLVSATVNNTNDALALDYQTNQYGIALITVRATDAVGLYVEDTFVVRVNRAHDGDPGDLDTSFNAGVSRVIYPYVSGTALQADGKIVIGGQFTAVGGTIRTNLARLNADGTLDRGFSPNAPGTVLATAVQADGKIVVGSSVGPEAGNGLTRLNADGTLDLSFNPNVSADFGSSVDITTAAVQPDGKIFISGGFANVGGLTRNGLARVNPDGTLDPGFNPNPNRDTFQRPIFYCMAFQADGKIVVGGTFSKVGGTARNYLARLNADGTLDNGFIPQVNNYVYTTAMQPDGAIVIGGFFTVVGGTARNYLARLNANGTLDAGFNPNVSGRSSSSVNCTAIQADGKIIVGGYFSTVGGIGRNGIARLNTDGTVDASFNPDLSDGVNSVTVQADGRIIISGVFTRVGGVARNTLVRLANDAATQNLAVTSANRIEWLRGGASPEVQYVGFDVSTDGGTTWTVLGTGKRIPGGWETVGLCLPASGQVRARARVTGGSGNGSSGLVETVAAFSLASPSPCMTGLGTFQLSFTNLSGGTFTALATTNLTLHSSNWTVLGPATEIFPGLFQFTDLAATNFPYRFYQIRSP